MTTVYLNGEFLPLEEARIPVLDRGFLFGDGVYELIPVYSRHPFRLHEHLQRLQASLDGIRLPNPLESRTWAAVIERIIATANFADQSIYIQVTRGADSKRDHPFPNNVAPTVFVMTAPLVPPGDALRQSGTTAITATDIRWLRCDLKTISLLANILLRQQAVDADCAETILLRDGLLIEGTASNIFIVKNGVLLAPPKSHLMLPGITYDVVLELAQAQALPFEIRPIPETELRNADEIWMTSSTREILPITRLDGQPVGSGIPGPCAQRMHTWYQTFKNEVMRVHTQ